MTACLKLLQPRQHCLIDWVVWHRSTSEDLGLLHSEASLGHAWLTLGHNLLAIGLGLDLSCVVGLDAVEELLAAARRDDVLDTHMHTLGCNSAANLLVHNHANRVGGDVEYAASAAVVELVGHALLDRRVGLNIHVVSQLVVGEVGGKVLHATLPEWAREHVTCGAAVTLRLRHLETSGGMRPEVPM